MKFKALFLSVCALSLADSPAFAQDRTWDAGAGTTNWMDPVNWSANTLPTSTNNAIINMASGAAVSSAGAAAAAIRIGSTGGSTGAVTVSGGGTLSNTLTTIAHAAGSTGSATVTGAGSRWTDSSSFFVGNNGNGTLLISAGGVVSNTVGYIGNAGTSTGAATVTGAGSQWINSSTFYVGFGGTATLDILNGGTVSNTIGRIGNNVGVSGTATVDGAGSTWTSSNTLSTGYSGNGTLVVSNGGRVFTANGLAGVQSGGAGQVTVSGAGSIYEIGVDFTVGLGGNGTVDVLNGGSVLATRNLYLGVNAGSNGELNIDGAGSIVNAGVYSIIGINGSGELNISNNGELRVTNVTAVGSYQGVAGSSGTGTLTLSSGGTLRTGSLAIADLAGSTGTLNIGADALDPAAAAGYLDADSVTFGAGTATINFNHTDPNYTFSSDMIGSGTINFIAGTTILTGDNSAFTGVMNGAGIVDLAQGELNISSNSSAYAGAIDVTGGLLRVNGSLGGMTTVSGSGRLQGSGTLDDVIFNSGGTAAPGNSIGTTSVTNVTFNPGSVYEVEVDGTGASDLINASGTATINGGTVRIIPYPDFRPSSPYTILTATGGVAGTFDGILDDLLFLDASLSYDANNAYMTLVHDTDALEAVANTPNRRAVARSVMSADNDAIDALFAMSDENEARRAFDLLSGEVHATLQGVLVRGQMALQSAAQNTDYSVVDGAGRMWVKALGVFGDIDGSANTASVDHRTRGVLIGIERFFSDKDGKAGIAFGSSNTDLSMDERGSRAESENYHLLGYVETRTKDGLKIGGGAGYTYHRIDTERDIAFGSFDGESDADYAAHTGNLYVNVAKTFMHKSGLALEPYAQGTYIYSRSNGFTESGEAGLESGSEGFGIGFADLGFKTAYDLNRGEDYPVILTTKLGYRGAIGDTEPQREMSFKDGGNNFKISGAPIDRHALVLGSGLDIQMTDKINFTVGYEGTLGQESRTHAVGARLNWKF